MLAARLRLGAMLSDLEPVVDQSYIRDETGAIVGRQPDRRGWSGVYRVRPFPSNLVQWVPFPLERHR